MTVPKYIDEVINEDNFDIEELLLVLDEKNIEDRNKIGLLELGYATDVISLREKDYSNKVKVYVMQNNFDIDDLPFLFDSYTKASERMKNEIKELSIKHIEEIIDNNYSAPYKLLLELFGSGGLKIDEKRKLLIVCLLDLDEERVKEFLKMLNMNTFLTLFQGKHPMFEVNQFNKDILMKFEQKKWITSFDYDKKDSNFYRAYGRKRQDKIS